CRVFLFSTLLIGRITCSPIQNECLTFCSPDYRSEAAAPSGSHLLLDIGSVAVVSSDLGSSDTNPEPVFSDPLYSFSSRSRYQRGRAMLAQSRYTPGEAVLPMAAARRSSKTPSKQNNGNAKGRNLGG
uniref:Uncharacterized protein n=1 Tax=Dicentrarchus labrax TaxID=13489 RepID=A0A8P4FZ59_DICLA